MSLRNQLKVFKYGLFYFKCDKSVSTLKLAKITKVLNGTNTKPGSTVHVQYGTLKEPLEAEIIAVEDDIQKLREVEIEFLNDSGNQHLFEEDDEEEEIQEDTAQEKRTENKLNKKKQVKKAKKPVSNQPQRKRKETSTDNRSADKTAQPQPKRPQKGKEPATVLYRYSPGKDQETNLTETETAVGDFVLDETFVVSSPATTFSSSTSPQHTTTLNHSIQSYHSPLSPSFHYSPLPSLPVSPILHDESFSTPRLHRVQRALIPSIPAVETAIGELEKRLVTYIDRKFDDLFSFLSQRYTPLPNFHATAPHTLPQTATQSNTHVHHQHFQTHHLPQPVHTHTSTATEDNEVVSSPDNIGLTNERLIVIRNHASSKMNFAVRLLREVYQERELLGRNVEGVRGKQALDPIRIQQLKKLIMQFYPVPPMEQEHAWRDCRKAIDSYLRKKKAPQ